MPLASAVRRFRAFVSGSPSASAAPARARLRHAAHTAVEALESRQLLTAVASDPFADGARTNGADPLDLPWYKPASAAVTVANDAVIASGNALKLNGQGGTYQAQVGLLPSRAELGENPGDSVTLSFDFRLDAVANTYLAFGLYRQAGTLVSSDGTINNSYNDAGYYGAFGTGTTALASINEEAGGTDTLTGGTGSGSAGSPPSAPTRRSPSPTPPSRTRPR